MDFVKKEEYYKKKIENLRKKNRILTDKRYFIKKIVNRVTAFTVLFGGMISYVLVSLMGDKKIENFSLGGEKGLQIGDVYISDLILIFTFIFFGFLLLLSFDFIQSLIRRKK